MWIRFSPCPRLRACVSSLAAPGAGQRIDPISLDGHRWQDAVRVIVAVLLERRTAEMVDRDGSYVRIEQRRGVTGVLGLRYTYEFRVDESAGRIDLHVTSPTLASNRWLRRSVRRLVSTIATRMAAADPAG